MGGGGGANGKHISIVHHFYLATLLHLVVLGGKDGTLIYSPTTLSDFKLRVLSLRPV